MYRLPRPGTAETGRFVKGEELKRLLYGSIQEAYGTEVFGDGITRSAASRELLDELARLNVKETRDGLTAADYPSRVSAAKARFVGRNTASNATFKAVRKALAAMCNRTRRCMYCEDSVADEVEHVRPKDLYPEAVFVWENDVYACGPCNGGKGARFAVVTPAGGVVDVTRGRGQPVAPPAAGTPALVDPRTEDGLLFMQLDLAGTFRFTPTAAPGTVDFARAEQTIDILKLNDRDFLVDARREAFGSDRARLREYAERSEAGSTPRQLVLLRNSLLRMGHPTVWAEMKRQQRRLAALRGLFARVPDALGWEVP